MSDKINPDRSAGRTLPALALTRAGGNTKPAPASVYLLADHLDTVLAAAEDIVNARLTWNSARRADQLKISQEKHSFRDDIEEIRKLENTIIIRVLTSRERAEDVARDDKRFRQLAKLYVAGTAVLLDAVQECGDSTDSDFATADAIPAYLRSRGLVDPEAPAPAIGENLQVGEDFLIAKRIAAGPLMDLAAALLDALEMHYDLFLDENELAMAPQINRFEDDAVSTAHDGGLALPKDAELEAAIEDVREDASQQDSASKQPNDVWSKMSTAGSVLAPVVSPPAPEPLVVVSKTQAVEDVAEDDIVTEIIVSTKSAASQDADAVDDEEVDSLNTETEIDLEPAIEHADGTSECDEVDAQPENLGDVSHDEASSVETALSEDTTVGTGVDETERDDNGLDATDAHAATDVEPPPVERPSDDADDNLIITAANDDETSASEDSQDTAEVTVGDEDKIALIADNTDIEPEASQAFSSETDEQDDPADETLDTVSDQSDTDAALALDRESEGDVEATAEKDADGAATGTNKDKRKKSKSLIGRLSLIKS